jgi:hypothetical protein
MPEAVIFTPGFDELNPEEEKKLKSLLNVIIGKLIAYKDNSRPIAFGIGVRIPGVHETLRPISSEGFSKADVEHIHSILTKPENTQGGLIISTDGEVLLHIDDGEILQDHLNVIPEVSALNIDTVLEETYREIAGQNLLGYIETMLQICGQKNAEGELQHTGKNYTYTLKNGQLKVTDIVEGREILNNSGFTKAATDKDITAMHSFKQVAQEIKPSSSGTPPPRFKM